MHIRPKLFSMLLLVCLVTPSFLVWQTAVHAAAARPLNILFIILDDVGKDQLTAFNSSPLTAAIAPNLHAIVAVGVKFTNFTATPECSPGWPI